MNVTIKMEDTKEKQQFHSNLLNDYELEYVRELAGQVAGFEPSDMWGRLTREKPQNELHHYHKLMNVKNQQDLTRKMTIYGGGFQKTVKHVLNVGSKVAQGTSIGVNFFAKHPELYKSIPFVNNIDPSTLRFAADALKEGSHLMKFGAQQIHTKRPESIPKNTIKQMEAGGLADSNFDKIGYGNKYLL